MMEDSERAQDIDEAKSLPASRGRFRRETPEDRRRHLAEAALRCIQKKGNAGVSVRQIATEAGVSPALITHHFGEIEELVAYAFDLMWDSMLQAITDAVDAAPPDPRARLGAFIEASFSPLLFDRDVLGVWVVFWGLILHSPRMSTAQKREYSSFLATVEHLLSDLAAAEKFPVRNIQLATIAFNALLDGLWLAWCLNPAAFRPEDGISLCQTWVDGFRRGTY